MLREACCDASGGKVREQLLELLWRHVVAVTVDSNRVVKGFNVLENQAVCMVKIAYLKAIQPFPLDQGMKGFDAGIVIGIALVTVTELELFGDFAVCLGYVLAATVRVKDQRLIGVSALHGLLNGVNNAGDLHRLRKAPRDDFTGIQVHNAVKVNKAVNGPNIRNVGAPNGIGTVRIELLVKDVVKFV